MMRRHPNAFPHRKNVVSGDGDVVAMMPIAAKARLAPTQSVPATRSVDG
jgi:hypothetical protein